MSAEETFNSIGNLIAKFVGKNNWIFLISVAAACAIGIYVYHKFPDVWWLISIFVLCCSIVLLNAITYVITKITDAIRDKINERRKHRAWLLEQEYNQKERVNAEKREFDRIANIVWPLVEYEKLELVSRACVILELPMSNNDKCTRFLKHPKMLLGEEYDSYIAISEIVDNFQYYDNRMHRTYKLLDIYAHKRGCIITINSYFYLLLENYKKTNKWKHVEFESYASSGILS